MNANIATLVGKVGDTIEIPIEITEADGSPADLTGRTIALRVWEKGTDTDLYTVPLTPYEPPTAGIAAIILGPTYGDLLPRSARYWFDIREQGGETIAGGPFFLAPDRFR